MKQILLTWAGLYCVAGLICLAILSVSAHADGVGAAVGASTGMIVAGPVGAVVGGAIGFIFGHRRGRAVVVRREVDIERR